MHFRLSNQSIKSSLNTLSQMHLVDDEQIRKDIQAVCQVQVLVETNPEAGDFEIKDDFF